MKTISAMQPASAERDLLASARCGDNGAIEKLIAKYQQRVFRVAQKITRNREDAEDITQVVFFKAFSRLHSFEGRSTFLTWLLRIAVNESLMQLRERRPGMVSIDDTSDSGEQAQQLEVADPGPGPERLCVQRELHGRLLAALERLHPSLRAVFMLRDVQGYSGQETAKILGVTDVAAKTRLFRARQALRAKLGPLFDP